MSARRPLGAEILGIPRGEPVRRRPAITALTGLAALGAVLAVMPANARIFVR